MMRLNRILLLGLLVLFSVPRGDLRADTYVFNIDTKQQEKAKNRWSLSEWLETRDRMRMMDLWLALHSSSPYEFIFSGMHLIGTREDTANYSGWNLGFAAYASLFGLELQYETTAPASRWMGLFQFRLMGYHNQATNLTLHTGIRQEGRNGDSLWSPLAGVSLTVYLAKPFGFNVLYRHSFAPFKGVGGGGGDRLEAGAFIDFSFVRVFADYFKEVEAGNRSFSYSGVQGGTRLYF